MIKALEKSKEETIANDEVLKILIEIRNSHGIDTFYKPNEFYSIFIDLANNDNQLREMGKLFRTALSEFEAFAILSTARKKREYNVDKKLAQRICDKGFIDANVAQKAMRDLAYVAEYEFFRQISAEDYDSPEATNKQTKTLIDEQKEFVKEGYDSENGKRDEIFISYADDDVKLADSFIQGIAPLEREHGIYHWHYKEMKAGKKFCNEIGRHLKRAKIVVALMSPNFVISDFIMEIELPLIEKMLDENNAKLFWFPLKEYTNFGKCTKVFRDTNALTQNIKNGTFEALIGKQRSRALNEVRAAIIDEFKSE
jgi:hypothetical protein